MKGLLAFLGIAALLALLYFSIWYIGKFVNYKMSYEGMVETTCRKIVIEELNNCKALNQ